MPHNLKVNGSNVQNGIVDECYDNRNPLGKCPWIHKVAEREHKASTAVGINDKSEILPIIWTHHNLTNYSICVASPPYLITWLSLVMLPIYMQKKFTLGFPTCAPQNTCGSQDPVR